MTRQSNAPDNQAGHDLAGEGQAARIWAAMRDLTDGYPSKDVLRDALNLGRGSGRVKALMWLTEGPMSLGTLAEAVRVDAPYATLIVDSLEERGLVERRHDPADRRRKIVALTPEGKEAAQRVMRIKREPPPGFDRLSAAELDTLEELVKRVRAGAPGPPTSRPPLLANTGRRLADRAAGQPVRQHTGIVARREAAIRARVRPGGAVRAQRAKRVHQAVDVGGAATEAQAGTDGLPVRNGTGPGQPREERVGAEPSVADADAVLSRQVLRDVLRGPAVDGEGDHADPPLVAGLWPHPQRTYPVDRGEPGDQAAGEESLVRLHCSRGQRVDKSTRGRERDRADHVRGAAFVPRGRRGPVGGVEAYLADRAAACQVRRGGVQPVAAADKHARAERRVDLVPGEREVVDA